MYSVNGYNEVKKKNLQLSLEVIFPNRLYITHHESQELTFTKLLKKLIKILNVAMLF